MKPLYMSGSIFVALLFFLTPTISVAATGYTYGQLPDCNSSNLSQSDIANLKSYHYYVSKHAVKSFISTNSYCKILKTSSGQLLAIPATLGSGTEGGGTTISDYIYNLTQSERVQPQDLDQLTSYSNHVYETHTYFIFNDLSESIGAIRTAIAPEYFRGSRNLIVKIRKITYKPDGTPAGAGYKSLNSMPMPSVFYVKYNGPILPLDQQYDYIFGAKQQIKYSCTILKAATKIFFSTDLHSCNSDIVNEAGIH
ncbi:MAG: hypothetical protein KGL51_05225 [Betaproteobacteria bacterium]|nr:hypothetical protein [Betaproteobacteria bacterium]MDE2122598.1 hypothetical protein [Betaproteobacteria bacterium]MDE2324058.1 hypothetical protein [Betaproteobacteria bacterium]